MPTEKELLAKTVTATANLFVTNAKVQAIKRQIAATEKREAAQLASIESGETEPDE